MAESPAPFFMTAILTVVLFFAFCEAVHLFVSLNPPCKDGFVAINTLFNARVCVAGYKP